MHLLLFLLPSTSSYPKTGITQIIPKLVARVVSVGTVWCIIQFTPFLDFLSTHDNTWLCLLLSVHHSLCFSLAEKWGSDYFCSSCSCWENVVSTNTVCLSRESVYWTGNTWTGTNKNTSLTKMSATDSFLNTLSFLHGDLLLGLELESHTFACGSPRKSSNLYPGLVTK